MAHDFVPNWMIFFHLPSTWSSDLYITKSCIFCWYKTAEKWKLYFFNHWTTYIYFYLKPGVVNQERLLYCTYSLPIALQFILRRIFFWEAISFKKIYFKKIYFKKIYFKKIYFKTFFWEDLFQVNISFKNNSSDIRGFFQEGLFEKISY